MDRRNCDVEFYVDDQSAEFNSECFLYIQDSNIGRINIYNLPDGIIYNKDGEKSPNNFYYTVSFEVINFDGEISEVRGSLFVMKTDGKQVEFLLSENGKVYVRKLEGETVGDFIESQKEIYDALKDMQSAVIDVKVNDLSVVVDGVANIPMDTYLAGLFKNVSYTAETGILTFTKHDNSTLEIDLPLEEIVEGGYYDSETNELVLVLANEEEIRIPVGELLSGIATEEYVDTKITNLDLNNRFNDKVDKVENSRLMTDLEGTKLANIEEYAEVNVLKTVKVDNVVQTITDKSINIDLSGKVDKTTTGNTRRVYGVNALNEQELTDIEATPTNESIKLVTSGGIYSALDGKVDKVEGYGLSKNDYTDTDVEKVGKIEIDGDGDKALLNDGSYGEVGKVDTVNDIGPDENKNIEITGEDIHLKDITTKTLTKGIEDIEDNIGDIEFTLNTLAGLGGDLAAYNFGGATPTQQQLNDYALSQISSITDPNDIFNNTRVKNLFDGNVWRLTNTPNTEPPVFEWINVGSDMIAPATDLTYGSVKGNDNISFTNGLPTVLKSADADKLGGELPGHYAKASDVVDKITTGNIRRVYGVNASNEQEAVEIETSPVQSSTKLITSGGIFTAISSKVDKVAGKGLSTNDYNDTDEEKVSKIVINGDGKKALLNDGTYGEVGTVDTVNNVLPDENKNITITADDISDEETTNKFATAEELAQIATNTNNINALETNKADKATTISGYGITDAYTKTEIESKIASVYKYKGSVANYASLPTTDLTIGDVYNVEDTGDNYAWTETEWDKLAGTVDLSNYATKLSIGQWHVPYRDISGTGEANTSRLATMTSPLPQALLIRDNEGKATFTGGTSANQGIVKSQLDSAVANMVTTDTTQTINGLKTFNTTPKITNAPTESLHAANKEYVDGALANPTILVNGDFFRNDNGTEVYSSAVASCINHFGFGLSGTTGSYNATTRTLKSDTFETGGKYAFLYQYIDNPARLNGKVVTLSAKAASTTGNFLIQLWKTSGGTTTSLGQTAINRTLFKSVSVTIPSGEFAEGDKLRVIFQTYGETALDYIKLEIGSLATAYTPEQAIIIREEFTATLPNTSWTGTSAPYSKEVIVSGILATDKPDFDLNLSSVSYADIPTIQSAWFNVYRTVSSADKITFYSHEIPSIDIPLTIKVVR